jgi:hypothetical protein
MTNRNTHPMAKWTFLATATAMLLIAGGCNSNKPETPVVHGEEFDNACAPRAVGQMAQSQSAAGAKSDGMLYDHNFRGDKLNSLGQSKLDLIVKGTPAGDPVVVYLNVPADGLETRRPAVLAYLKEGGLAEGKIKLVDGPNPSKTANAAMLPRIYKSREGVYDGQTAESADASSTSGGGMSASSGSSGGSK